MSQIDSKGSPTGIPGLKKHQQAPLKEGSIFSLNANKGSSGKFISHLLGLDHEEAANPNQAAGKSAQPLKSIKLSDFFHGIKFTPNFMFFLLFLGFFLWLFVIYWVRHHEPLADSVLGTPKANSIKAAADRRLVNGVKTAFPVQTSATTGEVYVPGVPAQPAPQQVAMPVQTQAMQAGTIQSTSVPQYSNQYGTAPMAPQALNSPYAPMPQTTMQQPLPSSQGNYLAPGHTARVKTIVNR